MLKLEIITPEKVLLSQEVDEVVIPTPNGSIGILPHHAPLISAVSPGELKTKSGGTTKFIATGAGFVEVSQNKVSVLADLAVKAEEIDEKAEEEARERARAALSEKRSDEEIAATMAMIERITAKLKVKRRHRTQHSIGTV